MNKLSKLHMIYIVLNSKYFRARLFVVPWNVISYTLARFKLT